MLGEVLLSWEKVGTELKFRELGNLKFILELHQYHHPLTFIEIGFIRLCLPLAKYNFSENNNFTHRIENHPGHHL